MRNWKRRSSSKMLFKSTQIGITKRKMKLDAKKYVYSVYNIADLNKYLSAE